MTDIRSHLQRPIGYAPKGTSLGLLGCTTLLLAPFMTATTLISVVPDGIGLFAGSMIPSLIASVPFAVIIALGLHKRRLWYVRFLFLFGAVDLVCYSVGILTWIAVWLHLIPERHPELRFALIMSGIGWAYFTLCAYWVVRMLRLRYWQPWSRPEQWEPGNETPPRWAPPPANR